MKRTFALVASLIILSPNAHAMLIYNNSDMQVPTYEKIYFTQDMQCAKGEKTKTLSSEDESITCACKTNRSSNVSAWQCVTKTTHAAL